MGWTTILIQKIGFSSEKIAGEKLFNKTVRSCIFIARIENVDYVRITGKLETGGV